MVYNTKNKFDKLIKFFDGCVCGPQLMFNSSYAQFESTNHDRFYMYYEHKNDLNGMKAIQAAKNYNPEIVCK